MVQFLKDPVFNTSLIVGYYWIPLCVLVVLYANIFHAAWTLSQKSREKEKEREKLLALSKKPGPGQPAAANPAVTLAASSNPYLQSMYSAAGLSPAYAAAAAMQGRTRGFDLNSDRVILN